MPIDPAFAFSDAKYLKLASTASLVIMRIIARVAGTLKALNRILRKKKPLSPKRDGGFFRARGGGEREGLPI